MSVDPPARIVVIGAGPVGLEAALYARYLGYEVTVFEQHSVCQHFLESEVELLPNVAGENRTSLGLAALQAQSEVFPKFDSTARETARTLAESYLLPLATSDLLADCVRLGQTVVRIERTDSPDDEAADDVGSSSPADDVNDAVNDEEDGEYEELEELEYAPFELLVRGTDGAEFTQLAEVVIDASGISNSAPIFFDSLRIELGSPDGGSETHFTPKFEFRTSEPNYYVVGSKSAGAAPFSIPQGHEQIRQLFTIIGGRATLNLYATFKTDEQR